MSARSDGESRSRSLTPDFSLSLSLFLSVTYVSRVEALLDSNSLYCTHTRTHKPMLGDMLLVPLREYGIMEGVTGGDSQNLICILQWMTIRSCYSTLLVTLLHTFAKKNFYDVLWDVRFWFQLWMIRKEKRRNVVLGKKRLVTWFLVLHTMYIQNQIDTSNGNGMTVHPSSVWGIWRIA